MPKRLLIVDDDPDILSTIKMVLEGEGYVCDTATRGREAVERQSAARYDLLILDYRLPELSGAEILKLLRDRGDTTPILFLSADRDFMSSIAAQPDLRALGKPFDIPEFLRLVAKLSNLKPS